MRIGVARVLSVCVMAGVLFATPAVLGGQTAPAPGWTFETIRSVVGIAGSCHPFVRLAGFAFDAIGRPVAGWSDNAACQSSFRWTRKEDGAWTERTMLG